MPYRDDEKRKAYAREYARVWRQNNPTKTSEHNRAYRRRNPEKVKDQNKRQNEQRKNYIRAWQLANPNKMKEFGRKSYRKHRLAQIEAEKQYRKDNPEKLKEYHLRPKTRAIMAAASRRHQAKQNGYAECVDYPPPPLDGKCAICHREAKPLCLDHDHETGKFRGYLCRNCNMALGKLGDTVEAIRRVLTYLEH